MVEIQTLGQGTDSVEQHPINLVLVNEKSLIQSRILIIETAALLIATY